MRKAKRIYEERSRQEMEGTIVTSEMFTDRLSGASFDLLKLKSGDSVRVEFDRKDKELLQALPTEHERVVLLKRRGYTEAAATLMSCNMSDFALLDPTFYVKRVVTTIQVDRDGGMYEVEIGSVNRILVTGDAAPSEITFAEEQITGRAPGNVRFPEETIRGRR